MKYYKQHNELTYQMNLYYAIKENLEVWGNEYELQMEYRYEDCIFDIVVAKKGEIVLIIETKKMKNGQFPNYKTPQIKKYSRFGVPVVICGYHKKITKVAAAVIRFVISNHPHEERHHEAMWKKFLAELKFMSTTKDSKKRRKCAG